MMRQFVLVLVFATVGIADVGVVDTLGGSTHDWQVNGPALRTIVGSAPFGLHVVWMYSSDTGQTFPDRNMRYNFYDYASRTWNWIDPDFMQSGVNVFTARSGFGNLAAYPDSGMAVVLCHQGSTLQPCAARDAASGAGIFEYCVGPTGYLWPVVGVTATGTIHVAFIDDPGRTDLWYGRIREWCNWDTLVEMSPPAPTFPTHNLAASRFDTKVCVTWTVADQSPYSAYYRISENDGDSWGEATELPPPPAFGPDTGFSYFITSPFPFYDSAGRLHIVVDGMPIIRDTVFAWPNEIWHWCPDNNPQWSRVHRADADPHGNYSPGVNALIACRPTIGEDEYGNLFVAWEQFDTANVEPQTNRLRADVWVTGSMDNGLSWEPALKITTPNDCSKRFPCIIDEVIPGYGSGDTVAIQYLVDQVAGLRAGSSPEGPWTYNPVVVHKIPVDAILPLAIAESGPAGFLRSAWLDVASNPIHDRCVLEYALPVAGSVSLAVYDASGRLVRTLVSGRQAAGRYSLSWDASDAAPGIYFCTLTAGGAATTRKLVRSH